MIVNIKSVCTKYINLLLVIVNLLSLTFPVVAQHRPVDRETEIPRLLSILHEEQIQERDPARLGEAIMRLGYMQVTEATDELIKLLTFKRIYEWETPNSFGIVDDRHVSLDGRYPAIGALMIIGKPVLPELIKVIENNDQESLEVNNALYAIKLIFRDNPKAGINYLEKCINQAHSVEAAYHLRIASTKFNNLEFE